MPRRESIDARFFAKVHITDGCWTWTACKDMWGYGKFIIPTGKRPGKVRRAHQVMFEQVYGPVPEGLTINHKCWNPSCVRPEHLELMTIGDNVRHSHLKPGHKRYRGGSRSANATHCVHGHPRTPENLIVKKNGTRYCRVCKRERKRVAYQEAQ